MVPAPKGRKRQASKNRAVGFDRRHRDLDILADGSMRSKVFGIAMKVKPDGIEHRESETVYRNVGNGRRTAIALMSPCSPSVLKSRCEELLCRFGIDWCQRARFVGCRLTVADIIQPRQKMTVKENEAVDGSLCRVTRQWASMGQRLARR